MPTPLIRVLFLCTGNSVRSQMAEGWARVLKGGELEAFSAGIAPSSVHPYALQVMAEAGVDISGQYSKHVDELEGIPFDWVVTLCDIADASCPSPPEWGKRVHRPFEDPILARGTKAEVLARFRTARNRIRKFVERMPGNLEGPGGTR